MGFTFDEIYLEVQSGLIHFDKMFYYKISNFFCFNAFTYDGFRESVFSSSIPFFRGG